MVLVRRFNVSLTRMVGGLRMHTRASYAGTRRSAWLWYSSALPVSLRYHFYLVKCILVVRQFPQKLMQLDTGFMKAYNFMFFRFTPATYWFILVHNIRSLLVALSPVLPSGVAQVHLKEIILLCVLELTVRYKPGRLHYANVLDCVFGLTAPATVCIGSCVTHPQDVDVKGLAWLCIATIGSTAKRSQRACQGTDGRLRDSGNLESLDQLFENVGHDTSTLAVLTSQAIYCALGASVKW